MRAIALVITGVVGLSLSAHADGFGPRFYNQTPPGLADYTVEETPDIAMDDLAKELNEIMPATGEEQSKPEDNVKTKNQKDSSTQ